MPLLSVTSAKRNSGKLSKCLRDNNWVLEFGLDGKYGGPARPAHYNILTRKSKSLSDGTEWQEADEQVDYTEEYR